MVIAGWIYLVSCRAFLFVALSSSLNLSVAGNKRNYIMPELSSECEYSWTEKDISENFKDTLNLKRTNLNDLSVSKKDINLLFLDSLKAKALKNTLIKKIISFIVVNPDSSTKVNINGKNDAAFNEYSGGPEGFFRVQLHCKQFFSEHSSRKIIWHEPKPKPFQCHNKICRWNLSETYANHRGF